MFETNSEMFLKIMERGRSEFGAFGDGVVLVLLGRVGVFLLLVFLG
jgi:hypothetical protein